MRFVGFGDRVSPCTEGCLICGRQVSQLLGQLFVHREQQQARLGSTCFSGKRLPAKNHN